MNTPFIVFESIDEQQFSFYYKSSIVTFDCSISIGNTYHLIVRNIDKNVIEHNLVTLVNVISDGTLIYLTLLDDIGSLFIHF